MTTERTRVNGKEHDAPKLDFPVGRANEIRGNHLLIYRNVRYSEPKADLLIATFSGDVSGYDGKSVELYDWKFNPESRTIYIRGAVYLGWGSYHQFEGTHKGDVYVQDVAKPSRSPNWKWNDFSGGWINEKTGKRFSLLTC